MKKIVLLGSVCSVLSYASAEEIQTPESGVYVGIGLANSQDKIEWSGSAVSAGGSDYVTTNFDSSARKFNGQLFFGYKNHEPFFWSLECRYDFSKRNTVTSFDANPEGSNFGILSHESLIDIEKSDDISVAVKIGKTIKCRITPYVLVGFYSRKDGFRFRYLTDLTDQADNDWRDSASDKSERKTRLMFGAGLVAHLDGKTDVRFEYCYKTNHSIDYQTVVNVNVDQAGYPRKFKQKIQQHCLSIGISRTICW